MIAPALPEDEPYLRRLGVPDIVPRDSDVVAAVRQRYRDGVDALLDTVSYEPGAYDRALKEVLASPHRTTRRAKGSAAPTGWPRQPPRTSNASRACSTPAR